jgi:LuxR family quorum sensing-dependent transcriptional regulator
MAIAKAFDLLASCAFDAGSQAFGASYLDALRPLGATSLWARSFYRVPDWTDPVVSTTRLQLEDHALIRRDDWWGSAAQKYTDSINPLAAGADRLHRSFFVTEVAPPDSRPYADYWAALSEFDIRDVFVVPYFGPDGSATGITLWFNGTDLSPVELKAIRLSSLIALDTIRPALPRRPREGRRLLTRRERDCLAFVAEGKSDWEISMILAISQSTAKFHIDNARRKLRATTRAQAVARALTSGELSSLWPGVTSKRRE